MVTTIGPNNKVLQTKQNLPLANKEGKWLGQGLGDIYDRRIRIRKNLKFRNKGQHNFKINHLMRQDSLPGIIDVGLRIEKTD